MRQLVRVVTRRQLHDKSGDAAHWRARPRVERVAAVELLRQRQHGWTDASRPRLQRVHRILSAHTENVRDFQPLVQLASERGEPVAAMLYTSNRRFPRTRRNPSPLLDALRRWLKQPAGHACPVDWLS